MRTSTGGLGWMWLAAAAVLVPRPAPAAPLSPSQSGQASRPQAGSADDETDVSELVVTGRKPPGAVIGDIKPELQLSPADIRAYGVSTVTELLEELAPQTRSDRGRGGEAPVVLLNGHRVSSFAEIQNIPTEAILRVDILPEEVALKYGYTANQRVVNIVLRRRFHAITAEAGGGAPTEGGETSGTAELDRFRVRGDTRLNLDLKAQASANLTDADRGIVEPVPPGIIGPGTPSDPGNFRTLVPGSRSVTANAVYARPIGAGINATVNATLGATSSEALLGLPSVSLRVPGPDPFNAAGHDTVTSQYVNGFGPLRQDVDGWTAHLGSTLNRDGGEWRLSLTGAYDHADTETRTDRGVDATSLQAMVAGLSPTLNPFVPLAPGLLIARPRDSARSITDGVNAQLLANGPLLRLPAGPLYVSLKAGDTESWQSSSGTRQGVGAGLQRLTQRFQRSDQSRSAAHQPPQQHSTHGRRPFHQRQRRGGPTFRLRPSHDNRLRGCVDATHRDQFRGLAYVGPDGPDGPATRRSPGGHSRGSGIRLHHGPNRNPDPDQRRQPRADRRPSRRDQDRPDRQAVHEAGSHLHRQLCHQPHPQPDRELPVRRRGDPGRLSRPL